MKSLRIPAALALAVAGATALAGGQALASPGDPSQARVAPAVLLVCNGSTSPCPATTATQYTTVQAAVDAAKAGDWILIWPGVYHENNPVWHAGVWVGTPNLHIRGLNRNRVIIDGSNSAPAHPCPASPARQNTATGRDGILIQASGVSVQNLTVCNYLNVGGHGGNQIWWNGGDGTGKIGMGSFKGSYLTATATYHPPFVKGTKMTYFGLYGIFVSNARGPGAITHSYAANMSDSAFYVGACRRVCNTVLAHDVAVNSALGYSGTNAGGRLVIQNSLFAGNRAGIVPNSLNNSDAPPPQDGRCPNSSTKSCTLIQHNLVTGNNNPNVPLSDYSAPIGTGIEISGGKYDTIRWNVIKNQGSWGVITHDYPDTETPPAIAHCQGGIPTTFLGSKACDFPARGNLIYGNRFVNVGFYGKPTNSDLATIGLLAKSPNPRNCFFRNRAIRNGKVVPVTSSPAHIERSSVDGPPCGRPGTWSNGPLFGQLVCASLGLCPKGVSYPQQTKLTILPLPKLTTMPGPCAGVPANEFCAK
jgi:hypothetical protein